MNKNCKNVTSVYWFIAALLLLMLYAANASAVLQRIPDPPDIKAVGYILVDANSGHVIAKNKANERMEPASLTKMMVSYVASRALKEGKISLDDEVTVSEK
ncbi:MAG: serine hydrolase, partial [Gammaproteobacteria bacterium]